MARIAAISLAKLSLKNIPKNRLIQITNFVIFIAFFAVSASIISLYYEKKIEGLNKQLSNEYGNEIIYNHWLAAAPKNISNIENIISKISTEQNYLFYIKSLNNKLITERELSHNSIKDLIRFVRAGQTSLGDSLNDAILISNSINDLKEIEIYKKKHQDLWNWYWKIEDNNKFMVLKFRWLMENKSEAELQEIYKKALIAQNELILILNEIKTLNIEVNINYFSNKKNESEEKIANSKNKIKLYSNKESTSILIAFLIQLIIFFIIQFFEFGFELVQTAKGRMKN
tara:strand:+ start:322 stop:1179 length:858 start_codon:yes stop_codon:yes gene_type:complete